MTKKHFLRKIYHPLRDITRRLDERTCGHKHDHHNFRRIDVENDVLREHEIYYCTRCGRINYYRIMTINEAGNRISAGYLVWAGKPRYNYFYNMKGLL